MPATGERRIVTVLISDVVDSTVIAERLGPERSKFLFDELAGLMTEQIRRFDGTVAQLTGDGVLALFGAPTAHGDDAERAVLAALAIHNALGRYAAEVASAYGIELAARVAVNTGLVVVPARDATPDVLYNALGDTVNVAARLQPHAGVGGVAIGPATARQLAGRFQLEPLGELALKGKSEPVAAFRVLGEAEPELTKETPLVGRERELATLVGALDRLHDGVGAIVSITGEPGIGKSRLVSEGLAGAADGVRVLVGRATSYTTEAPYWPVRDLLCSWLGIGVAEPEGRLRLELKTALGAALNGQAGETYTFLAALLGIALEGDDERRLRDLSRDSVQRQTFEAVALLFESLAREQALCLVFEDLHWADGSTLALIQELFDLCDEEATALLLLYRSEREHEAWHLGEVARQRFPHRLVEVELRPLATEDSKQLAGRAAGADLPAEVSELLAARSGGNPFFLEEALRDLVERGVLEPVNAHWELTIAVDELTVPLLVQEALQARLDRLAPATREVASVASVIGPTFGLPLLERLIEAEGLRSALSELQRLDLVVEERRRPSPEYRFRHGLVQEVAYASLTETRRRELHLAAGAALEELHAETLEEVYEPLARHFSEAGAPEKAVTYLLAAGDAAWALYADRAALEHYERALGFIRDDDPRGRDLLFQVALAHHLDFDFASADSAWREACALPHTPGRAGPLNERIVMNLPVRQHFAPGYPSVPPTVAIASDLFSGLLRLTRGLNVVPDAASEIRVSDDGLQYHATLRRDAVWSDGEPLTAGDFTYAWDAMRTQQLESARLLDDIAEATAIDDRTLTIRLHEPRSYFPYLLAQPYLFPWPRHRCEHSPDGWFEPPTAVSNGAFTLAAADEDEALLVANDRWRGPRGNVAEVVIRFTGTNDAVAAWNRGELDLVPIPVYVPDDLPVEQTPVLGTMFLGFDAEETPFDDLRVRRAFAHALDRVHWSHALGRGHEPATSGGLVPPAMPGHTHRIGLDYDLERARELLASAGYSDHRPLPAIRLATPISVWAEPVADQLRRDLDAVVEIATFDVEADPRSLAPRPACWVHGWVADFPDPAGLLGTMMNAPDGHTAALYRNADLLERLARWLRTTNRDERLRLCQEFEREWLTEHVALVPLGYSRYSWLHRPWVENSWASPILPGHLSDIVVRR